MIKLLDHGFVSLVEHWGSDERIIEAARESTDKGFLGWGIEETCAKCSGSGTNEPENGPGSLCKVCHGSRMAINTPGDEKLLAFLDKNRHTSPFEFAGAIIRVQAPIFVFREWHRHRTQAYSEISARYTPLPDFNYIPTIERLMLNANSANKQAGTIKGAEELTEKKARIFQEELRNKYEDQQALYTWALNSGVPKELARIHLPVGRYSRMRATTNLHNWLHFLTLREASGAQWEIRQYAHAVSSIIKGLFPRTHALYVERTGR